LKFQTKPFAIFPLKGKKGKGVSTKGFKGKSSLGNRGEMAVSSSVGVTNLTENVKPIICDFCHKPNYRLSTTLKLTDKLGGDTILDDNRFSPCWRIAFSQRTPALGV
jgi:hypothetical protein